MLLEPACWKWAALARSHGLRGEVLVDLISDRPERSSPGAVHITADGELTVLEARRHQQRWIFKFAGCDRREDADALRGTVLWGDPIDDEATLWVHDLVGCMVVDDAGVERGTVVAVLANPAADLLELDSGSLVPTNFVVGVPVDGVVSVDVPDGLFEL